MKTGIIVKKKKYNLIRIKITRNMNVCVGIMFLSRIKMKKNRVRYEIREQTKNYIADNKDIYLCFRRGIFFYIFNIKLSINTGKC